MKTNRTLVASGLAAVLAFASLAYASGGEDAAPLKQATIDVSDNEQIRRGLAIFTDICMGCHSAKYLTYQNLLAYPEIGLGRDAVDELRGGRSLLDGMTSSLGVEEAIVSYGKMPPDLSLIVPGRRGGADYIYSLLTGYERDPAGIIPDGDYNIYFPGKRIAMPDPFSWLDRDLADTADLEQQAQDVSAFLAFVADPHQNERHRIGYWVMGFLLLLTWVLWRLKVEVWKDVKH